MLHIFEDFLELSDSLDFSACVYFDLLPCLVGKILSFYGYLSQETIPLLRVQRRSRAISHHQSELLLVIEADFYGGDVPQVDLLEDSVHFHTHEQYILVALVAFHDAQNILGGGQ